MGVVVVGDGVAGVQPDRHARPVLQRPRLGRPRLGQQLDATLGEHIHGLGGPGAPAGDHRHILSRRDRAAVVGRGEVVPGGGQRHGGDDPGLGAGLADRPRRPGGRADGVDVGEDPAVSIRAAELLQAHDRGERCGGAVVAGMVGPLQIGAGAEVGCGVPLAVAGPRQTGEHRRGQVVDHVAATLAAGLMERHRETQPGPRPRLSAGHPPDDALGLLRLPRRLPMGDGQHQTLCSW